MARAPASGAARFYAAGHAAARFRLQPQPWRGDEARSAARAATLFESIGAGAGMARAAAVLRRLGAATPGREAAGPLSGREMEVAGLVADGLSNPAIAATLYLSRATVASHVAHILTKLGFSSRSQIAAWFAERRPRPSG